MEAADVVNDKTSKYLLTTNTQDQEGEVTTKLYKGDVIPTVGGGRQVVFNDVEVLTQESPERRKSGKRSFEEFRGIEVNIFLLMFTLTFQSCPSSIFSCACGLTCPNIIC